MKRNFLFGFIFLTVAFTVLTTNAFATGKKSKKSKPVNIILFIGDGMGPAQLSAAIALSDNTLVFERFPYSGYCKTSSYDKYITDSAAAGTALATGVKTRNGMIGMAPDSTDLQSIMDIAHKNGLSTGLVSTSAITHATPASFVANNAGRGNYEEIALDFLDGTIDVFIGGGQDHFIKRKDGRNLAEDLKKLGYDVVLNIDELANSGSEKMAGLLEPVHMDRVTGSRKGKLEIMTETAIKKLSRNKKGFILMVEGSQIDFAGHENDFKWNVAEVIDFENAISKAMQFAENDGKTLVVVTADHETGALSLTGGDLKKKTVTPSFGSKGHTAVLVPVFSFGPGADRFTGIIDNTFFFNQFSELLRLKNQLK